MYNYTVKLKNHKNINDSIYLNSTSDTIEYIEFSKLQKLDIRVLEFDSRKNTEKCVYLVENGITLIDRI